MNRRERRQHGQRGPQTPARDGRIVYGAGCTWWDSIDKAAPGPPPRCPHCNGVLLEVDDLAEWWANVDRYERDEPPEIPHPGYRKMMEWARGRCFPNLAALTFAYNAGVKT